MYGELCLYTFFESCKLLMRTYYMNLIDGEPTMILIYLLMPYRPSQLSIGADVREGHHSAFLNQYVRIETDGGQKLRGYFTGKYEYLNREK